MLNFIDISNWQPNFPVSTANIDAVIVKATEGLNYVDPTCDGFVQQAIQRGLPWGFYHFARNNGATAEADFFIENTVNYFNHGIPVLDWESDQSVAWVNKFVRRVHDRTGIWPWIYANPWRFNQGGVEQNCMRWVAGYPKSGITDWSQISSDCPYECDGLVGAWQFTSSGRMGCYDGNLDMDFFYGDVSAWNAYAGVKDTATSEPEPTEATEDYVTEFARHVINGEYGNGDKRKQRIYDAVQSRVNELLG